MNTHTAYKIPLGELLALLKARGYELSIEQILEIQSTLLSSELTGLNTGELKFILTPIIAKNDEEQTEIYKIIDLYIAGKTRQSTNNIHGFRYWLFQNRRLVFALKIAAFALVIATGILVYIRTHHENKPLVNKLPTTNTQNPDSTGKGISPTAVPTPSPQNTGFPVNKDQRIAISAPKPHGTIIPEIKDIRLQLSLVFGCILGAILFYILFHEQKKKMEMEERKRTEGGIFTIPTDGARERSGSADQSSVHFGQAVLQFPEKDYLIQRPGAFQHIKSSLKKPALVENPALDIKKTIYKSARTAGFASLVYADPWKDRKYIFITDNTDKDAHITHLLNYVTHFLSAAITPVTRYTFTSDIRVLKDSNDNTVPLENLYYDYPGYHLVIISNCYSFFTEESFLQPGIHELFSEWTSKSVITPVALLDWSYKEEQLQNRGFNIVPADIDAIELLGNAIAENDILKKEKLAARLSKLYAVSDFKFHTATELKIYLKSEQLFQLVCSLAVYPVLKWSLTLALFDAILKNYEGEPALTYDILLKVSRIPWLNADKLDDSIRVQLLNGLEPETEMMARETILQLLDEIKPSIPHESASFKEFQVQYNINSFFLYSHDQYKYREYAGVKDVINYYWDNLVERALKEHVNSKGNDLIPTIPSKTPATVEGFVLQEKQFEKRNITLTRAAVLTIPAFLIYIGLTVFKPAIAYPAEALNNVSIRVIINKNTNCQQHLIHTVVTVNGRSKTIPLNSLHVTDTILIPDIRYSAFAELALYAKDSTAFSFSVPATDSFFTINAGCNFPR